jgi:hypothetical protein
VSAAQYDEDEGLRLQAIAIDGTWLWWTIGGPNPGLQPR